MLPAMKKLIQISAFWKNNVPEGLGITLDDSFGDLDEFMQIIEVHYDLMWSETEKANDLPNLIQLLRDQLLAIASDKPLYDLSAISMIIGNVYLLEQHGQMITDEFNGLQLAYVDY
jgi:hypothetical protein